MMAVMALEEVHSAATMPKERSPPAVARHRLVQVLLDQPERIARLYLGQHLHHTVQQIREGQVAQQHGQEEEQGEQREEKGIGELGGLAEAIILLVFVHDLPRQFR